MLLHHPLECSRRCSLQHHGGAASTRQELWPPDPLHRGRSHVLSTPRAWTRRRVCPRGRGPLSLFEVSRLFVLLGAVVSAVCVGVREEHSQERYFIGKSGTVGGDSARRLVNEC